MSFRYWRWVLIAAAVVVSLVLGFWLRSDSAEHRWAAIESALQRRGWSEAEPRLQAWLRRSPDDGKAWLRLGGVLGFEGREAQSLEAFEHIKPSDPEWLQAQMQIAEIWLNRRQLTRAEGVLRAASDRDTSAVEPRRRLVYVLTLSQRHDEARSLLWDLFRITHEPRQLATLVGLGATEADSRDLARELDVFVKAAPDDPWMRRAWGMMLSRIGKKSEARPYLETAAARFENDPIGRLALADCLVERGELEAAEKTLGAKPIRPDDLARWWLLRGEILAARGKMDEAIAAWRSSADAAPFDRSVLYRLGQALVRHGKAGDAKPYLDQVEILRVREVNLINALDRLVRGERTREVLEQLATLCRDAGRLTEARSWFEELVRLDPTNSQAQIAVARLASATEAPAPLPRLRSETAERPAIVANVAGESSSTVVFEDVAKRSGIDFQYDCASRGDMFLGDTMGGGVGLIDFDGDGWLDVYLVNGCPLPYDRKTPPQPNKLFRNRRDGTFEDVTARAGVGGRGYGMGCAVGDIDNDGHDDLFVTGLGSTVLYRNRGDGTFEDVTDRAGVGSALWTTAAGFGDLDGDGDLDLVAVTYVEADPVKASACLDANGKPIHCPPGRFPPQFDLLFRNNGDGTFTEVGHAAGLHIPGGDGLGLAIADLDSDGKLDIFVANDASPNFLFRNLGGLKFEEIGTQAGVAYDGNGRATASMGVVAEDLDGDGRIDLFHTNYINEPSTLLHNLGGGLFDDATARAGLDSTGRAFTGFGTVALDADNDGLLDLFVANGHVDDRPWINHPMAQFPHFFHGRLPGRFRLAPPSVSPYFSRPVVGRGVAAGDLDNDGRVDLVVVHRDQRVSLLHNTTPGGHWLGVRLKGTRSGKTPVGARVTCRVGKKTAVRWVTSGTSYLSSNDPRLWFGLGTNRLVDQIEVRWPSGTVQSWQGLEVDRIFEVIEGGNPTRR
jgi:tetratricopeptide (TPR) repeat protein